MYLFLLRKTLIKVLFAKKKKKLLSSSLKVTVPQTQVGVVYPVIFGSNGAVCATGGRWASVPKASGVWSWPET